MCSFRLPNLQLSRKVRSPAPPASWFIPPKHSRFATKVDLHYFVFSSTIEYERCGNVSYLQLPSFYHSAISCPACGMHFTRPVFPKSKHSPGVRQYVKLGNRGFRESWPLSEQRSLSAVPVTPRVSHCTSLSFRSMVSISSVPLFPALHHSPVFSVFPTTWPLAPSLTALARHIFSNQQVWLSSFAG